MERLHGRPVIGIPGRAAEELRSGAPAWPFERPDLALIERELPGSRLLGASARGVQHKFRAEPRQDSFGVACRDETWVVVVADGVGEFARSHLAADALVGILCADLAAGEDLDDLLVIANDTLIEIAADEAGPAASTVLIALVEHAPGGAFKVDLTWVGDPYAYALSDGVWEQLNPLEAGDAAYATTAAEALPATVPAVRRRSVEVDADALFFMTDGVGVPLSEIADVRATLAQWWVEPPAVHEFAAQVEFARRGYMDDRTVVGVWSTDIGGQA